MWFFCENSKFQLNDDNEMLHEMIGLSQNIRETQLKNKFEKEWEILILAGSKYVSGLQLL